jgi:hypothetical protein
VADEGIAAVVRWLEAGAAVSSNPVHHAEQTAEKGVKF